MARCEVSIELDDERASFRPGERISGRVQVRSSEHLRARLVIFPEWRTNGAPDVGCDEPFELFEGEWEAGSESSHPFELEAPLGPLSYAGAALKVGWRIRACAEIRWLDAWAERDFVLRAWEPGELLQSGAEYRCAPTTPPAEYVFGSVPPRPRPALNPGDTAIFPTFRQIWARLRLGGRPVIHAPARAAAGDRLVVRVVFPKGHRPLGSIVVRLIGREVVLLRSPDPTASSGVLDLALAHFDEVDAVPDGSGWVAELAIPTTAPPTFSGKFNDLRYHLQIDCAAKGAPAWRAERSLILRPPRSAADAARRRA